MPMKQKEMNYKIHPLEQRTEEWFAMREGLITGSTADRAKAKGDSYVYEVVGTMLTMANPSNFKTSQMQWGEENEPLAREAYVKKTGLKVQEVGFITNGKLGLSPDGVVFNGEQIERTIEIKCPDTKNHVKYCIENKVPKEHLDQIVHNFVVIDDLKILDFISYDPRCKVRPLFIKSITRDALTTEIELAKVAYERHLTKLDSVYKQMIL